LSLREIEEVDAFSYSVEKKCILLKVVELEEIAMYASS